jgi:arylsulfatase A-like enzyme
MRPETQGRAAGWLDDLPLFSLTQHFCAAAATLLAKAFVLWTYGHGTFFGTAFRFPAVAAFDFLLLGIAAVPIVIATRFPRLEAKSWRGAVGTLAYLAFTGWIFLTLANAVFLVLVGSPLNRDLLALGPHLGKYFFNTATRDTIGITVVALSVCVVPLFLTPPLLRLGRGRTHKISSRLAFGLLAAGLLSMRLNPETPEDRTLRTTTIAHALFWNAERDKLDAPPPTTWQAEIVARLQGEAALAGRMAFSALPRRPHNIVLVVWESVGERYLRTHHLGDANTPNLNRLSDLGSVRFRQAYSESPLSVQSVWTFFTGRSPPANASIFLNRASMPAHGPSLPEVLKDQGYRTSVLIGSYTRSWGADRIVQIGGVDMFEDIENLLNRDRYKQVGWSIDGRGINDRFWSWLDQDPGGSSFFSVLWNVDTHYPYRWAAMSADDDRRGDAERYTRVIEHADRLLGEIAYGLEARGLDKNTLIVVAGDHGEGLARPPHLNQKVHGALVFEDSIHVPLVFLHRGIGGAHSVNTPVILSDVYPTVLDLVGAPLPEGLNGVSLARAMAPRSIFFRGMQGWPAAIRAGDFKLVAVSPGDRGALFRLREDPMEANDLSLLQPETALALKAHLAYETTRRGRLDPSLDSEWRSPWIPDKMRPATSPRPIGRN